MKTTTARITALLLSCCALALPAQAQVTSSLYAPGSNIPAGAPGAPVEGSVWTDSSQKALAVYVGGVAQKLDATLFSQISTQTVGNTTTETSILGTGTGAKTLPANLLTPGKVLRLKVRGVYSTAAILPTLTVRVKLGGVTLASQAITNLIVAATNSAFSGEIDIKCRTAGASGTVDAFGALTYSISGSTRGFAELNTALTPVVVDTTAALPLDATVQWSAASASNTVSSLTATVQVID